MGGVAPDELETPVARAAASISALGVSPLDVARLAAPTPPGEVKQRQGNKQHGGDCDKLYGVCQLPHRLLDYVDARYVMRVLDEIVGPENWQRLHAIGPDGKVAAGISVRIDGEWVAKWDGAGDTDIEGEKGSFSDSFKRAGVNWGIARDLYGKDAGSSGQPAGLNPVQQPAPAQPQPQPQPQAVGDDPDGVCPSHGVAWVLKPGGVSKKTNKPYDPFWACPSNSRPFCQEKPDRAWVARQELG